MSNDYNVLGTFNLHDNWLKANNDIAIRFTTAVAVIVLILITRFEVFWILFLNLLISQTVANARVNLVESFPFELFIIQKV